MGHDGDRVLRVGLVATRGSDAATTHRHAIREDDSRRAAELVLIAACIASLAGVAVALLLRVDRDGRYARR